MTSVFGRAVLVATMAFSALSYAQQQISVQDKMGQPIIGATIMFGFEPGNPFEGNVITTDGSGIAATPADWKAALPVTVQAAGFVSQTLPVTMPSDLIFALSTQEGMAELEVAGETTDFGRLRTDGKVDFGLVIPALNREQMLGFDLSTVISPKTDTITIIGNDVELPSNLTLPEQTESYIFPITFNKPGYRVYVRNPGPYTVSATHGQFPLQRVVNDIRDGKSMFELINHFKFLGAGQQPVDVQGDVPGQNVPVNQVAFDTQVSVTAPAYPAGLAMVSLALVERDGLLAPTDLKRIEAGRQMNLASTAAAGTQNVLSLLLEQAGALIGDQRFAEFFAPLTNLTRKKGALPHAGPRAQQSFAKMSFTILPAAGGVAPQFLPLVSPPLVNGTIVNLTAPAEVAGLTSVATYLLLSEVESVGSGATATERRTRLWEVWEEGWVSQIELPNIEFPRNPARKYRWEVMFMARPTNFVGAPTVTSGVDLSSITHVTRNAIDL